MLQEEGEGKGLGEEKRRRDAQTTKEFGENEKLIKVDRDCIVTCLQHMQGKMILQNQTKNVVL